MDTIVPPTTISAPSTNSTSKNNAGRQHRSIGMAHSRCLYCFRDPYASSYTIKDVCWGLSRMARFLGQTRSFFIYSVAQHSVLTSYLVPVNEALAALLHDGHEFACGDVVSPLKALLADYRELEDSLAKEFRLRYSIPLADSPLVTRADRIMLITEMRDLTHRTEQFYPELDPLEKRLVAWPGWYARYRFMKRFHELTRVARHAAEAGA